MVSLAGNETGTLRLFVQAKVLGKPFKLGVTASWHDVAPEKLAFNMTFPPDQGRLLFVTV